MRFREEIDLGFVFIGTLIGAGFASGQEIMLFFTRYGKNGLMGLMLSCVLFFVAGHLILKNAIRMQSSGLREILRPYIGERLMFVIDMILYFYLFIGFYIMLSGCAAVLRQSFELPYNPCCFILCVLCMWWLTKGIGGLADFNKIIVPLMILLIVLISYYSIRSCGGIEAVMQAAPPGKKGWWVSALLYFSYNMTSMSVVLASLGKYTRREQAALGAGVISAIGVFASALGPYLITTAYFDVASKVDIPLLAITQSAARGFNGAAVIILMSAMLTTALSYGYAFAAGLSERFHRKYNKMLLLLILGWPFTTAGFSKLIATIYPLFGIVGIFFAAVIFLEGFSK